MTEIEGSFEQKVRPVGGKVGHGKGRRWVGRIGKRWQWEEGGQREGLGEDCARSVRDGRAGGGRRW